MIASLFLTFRDEILAGFHWLNSALFEWTFNPRMFDQSLAHAHDSQWRVKNVTILCKVIAPSFGRLVNFTEHYYSQFLFQDFPNIFEELPVPVHSGNSHSAWKCFQTFQTWTFIDLLQSNCKQPAAASDVSMLLLDTFPDIGIESSSSNFTHWQVQIPSELASSSAPLVAASASAPECEMSSSSAAAVPFSALSSSSENTTGILDQFDLGDVDLGRISTSSLDIEVDSDDDPDGETLPQDLNVLFMHNSDCPDEKSAIVLSFQDKLSTTSTVISKR